MKFLARTNDLFDDVFDDMFGVPFISNANSGIMKTDITEKDGYYCLDIELPGCRKEDIQIGLKDGYLNISASRNSHKEDKDEQGNLIRQERYSGSFARSFFVGKDVNQQDIKANYENGELKIIFPKEKEKLPENQTIMID